MLDNYDEIKYIKDCNDIYKTFNYIYKRGNERFIKAFRVFKVLRDTVGKLTKRVGGFDQCIQDSETQATRHLIRLDNAQTSWDTRSMYQGLDDPSSAPPDTADKLTN